MATFPSIEASYGITKNSAPNIKRVQFGDGYQARLRYGENQNAKQWIVTFKNITETDSDTIETFLDARVNDAASFDWTPPNEGSSLKFFCFSWRKTIPYPNRATIVATFEQIFEP